MTFDDMQRALARLAIGAVANAALASSPLAAPSPDHREPGIESARVYDVMIVPCQGEDCETDPPPYARWLERDPQLRAEPCRNWLACD